VKPHLKSVIYVDDDTTDLDAFIELKSRKPSERLTRFSAVVISPDTNPKVRNSADIAIGSIPDVRSFLSWPSEICYEGFHPH